MLAVIPCHKKTEKPVVGFCGFHGWPEKQLEKK